MDGQGVSEAFVLDALAHLKGGGCNYGGVCPNLHLVSSGGVFKYIQENSMRLSNELTKNMRVKCLEGSTCHFKCKYFHGYMHFIHPDISICKHGKSCCYAMYGYTSLQKHVYQYHGISEMSATEYNFGRLMMMEGYLQMHSVDIRERCKYWIKLDVPFQDSSGNMFTRLTCGQKHVEGRFYCSEHIGRH